MKKYILLFIFSAFYILAFGQMPKWCIPDQLIDFSPLSTFQLTPPTSNYQVANGAYDENGNLLFYVEGHNIKNAAGTVFGTFGTIGNNLGAEISIVKKPETCDTYYVIGTDVPIPYLDDTRLIYSEIEVIGATPSVGAISNQTLMALPFNDPIRLAVSKLRPDRTRILFIAHKNSVDRFTIDRTGINTGTTIVPFPPGTWIEPFGEADLMEDGTHIKLMVSGMGFNLSHVLREIVMDNQAHFLHMNLYNDPIHASNLSNYPGVEYVSTDLIVFSHDNGITLLDTNFPALPTLISPISYLGHIEKAKDGKLYTPSYDGLHEVLISGGSILSVPGNFPRTLPDQVDDEDYIATEYKADLWISDGFPDQGFEPNLQTSNVWGGDIWNCIGNPNCTKGQSQPARFGDLNFMKVEIINKGCTTSAPADLHIYWTRARSQEMWDAHFLSTAANMIGNCFAGGEITNQADIGNIPPIPAGNGFILVKEWTNLVPDPACFINDGHLNGDYGTNNPMICYLGRIESLDDPMVESWTPRHVYYEVFQNNNVATRNSTLIDLTTPRPSPDLYTLIVNNPASSDMNVTSIILNNMNELNDFIAFGEITIVLEPELYERWTMNGYAGEGIEDLGEGRIRITDGHYAEMSNLEIQPGENFNIGLTFNLSEEFELSEEELNFQYHLTHIFADRTLGSGFNFNLIAPAVSADGRDQKFKNDPNINDSVLEINVQPNPISSFVKIQINGPDDQKLAKLTIHDMTGKEINLSNELPDNTVYPLEMELDLSTYPKGIYVLTITTASGASISEYLIKQ